MANTITIKHGSSVPTTTNLAPWELGYNIDNGILYINKNGAIAPINHPENYLPLSGGTLTGNLTIQQVGTEAQLDLKDSDKTGRIFYRASDYNFGFYLQNATNIATRLRYNGTDWYVENAGLNVSGGLTASSWLKAKAYAPEQVYVGTYQNVDTFLNGYSSNYAISANHIYFVTVSLTTAHPVLGGGAYTITGAMTSTDYEWQKAESYNGSSTRAFYRSKMAGTWTTWAFVWTSTTDGSGSGLDADTLDGSHASAFSLTSHDHSGTYLPLSGGTLTGTIYNSQWYRSTGATGWFNETYAGGWYMTDTTWIRNYNSKPLYITAGIYADYDHTSGTTPRVVNVIMGTGAAPTASSVPQGTIFLKYIP